MYSIFDTEAAINQVLEYLGLAQNGVYGERERGAVTAHQRAAGLTESGVVDLATFNSLRDTYRRGEARSAAPVGVLSSPSFPYSFGDTGNDVAVLNSMLADVLTLYTTEGYLPRGSYFTRDSENAVRELRRIFRLPDSNELDEDFFVILRLERERIPSKE
ncbi:MAG: peptidoglycan-binding protein [Clostridia bacterium]|nr:peptidoglycan-binding protein [Clostridia bacterium]